MAALGTKLRTLEGKLFAFWCPGCNESHHVNSGWTFNGDGDRPTFYPSILVQGTRRLTDDEATRILNGEKLEIPGFVCHSFVRDGRIEFLSDCTHSLAGQTVDLPNFDPESPYCI